MPFNDIDALEAAFSDHTAGVVLEMIQGEGGIYPLTPAFVSKARELATYFVGQVVGSLNKVQPARSVVLDMVSEFIDAVGRLDDLVES